MGVEFGVHGQQVFFGGVILGQGGGFIGHQTEPAVYLHGDVHGFQAALALLAQGHLGCQVQPSLCCARHGPQFTCQGPLAGAVGQAGLVQTSLKNTR